MQPNKERLSEQAEEALSQGDNARASSVYQELAGALRNEDTVGHAHYLGLAAQYAETPDAAAELYGRAAQAYSELQSAPQVDMLMLQGLAYLRANRPASAKAAWFDCIEAAAQLGRDRADLPGGEDDARALFEKISHCCRHLRSLA